MWYYFTIRPNPTFEKGWTKTSNRFLFVSAFNSQISFIFLLYWLLPKTVIKTLDSIFDNIEWIRKFSKAAGWSQLVTIQLFLLGTLNPSDVIPFSLYDLYRDCHHIHTYFPTYIIDHPTIFSTNPIYPGMSLLRGITYNHITIAHNIVISIIFRLTRLFFHISNIVYFNWRRVVLLCVLRCRSSDSHAIHYLVGFL